ncbi:MAG: TatD family hydrolase [Anaerolineaceae bacterium]
MLHSFHQNEPRFEEMVSAGFYFGIGGPVTYQNSRGLPELVRSIPSDRLLLETDAPFLPPHPHRGQRSEPAYIRLIAEKVASIRTDEDFSEVTFSNAARLFSWRREH